MNKKISNLSTEDMIYLIVTQTIYSREEATEKLILSNYDYIKVIREYMGIPEKKVETKVKSINQEVYKQIRTNLDISMKEYRDAHPIDIEQVIQNFTESDEREKTKQTNKLNN